MISTRHPRTRLLRLLLALSALGGAAGLGERLYAAPVDPVIELRNALADLPRKADDEDHPVVLKHREAQLKARTDALRTVNELRRALVLKEWQDNRIVGRTKLCDIDQKYRNRVGDRFIEEVRRVLASDNATAQIAVVHLLGEMGPNVRALDRSVKPLDPKERRGFVRAFTPDLVKVAESTKDPAVRRAAVTALGRIDPLPKAAAALLDQAIQSESVQEKRVAAETLVTMIETLIRISRVGTEREGVDISPPDVIEACVAILPVAKRGLDQTDSQVCRRCAAAIRQTAEALNYFIPEPFQRKDLPPRRNRTPAEEKHYREKVAEVRAERVLVSPLVLALKQQGKSLAGGLQDTSDAELRLYACQSLELMASARLRLLRRVADVPDATVALPPDNAIVPVAQKIGEDALAEVLLEGIQPSLPAIPERIRDKDVRVRRATVDFLEMLEDAAQPVLPALITALSDEDLFVRWAAARSLGKMEAKKVADAVPHLARLLEDPDLDVRLAAASTIDTLGPVAKDAMPQLIKAASRGDVEFRIVALRAISSINGSEAAAAVDALIAMLREPDARIRAASAYTLGTLGPLARAAEAPLRQIMNDDDPLVRRAVSDALLNILLGPSK